MTALESLKRDVVAYERALFAIAYDCMTQEQCEKIAKQALNIDVDTSSEEQLELWTDVL